VPRMTLLPGFTVANMRINIGSSVAPRSRVDPCVCERKIIYIEIIHIEIMNMS